MSGWRVAIAVGPLALFALWAMWSDVAREYQLRNEDEVCARMWRWTLAYAVVTSWLLLCIGVHMAEAWSVERAKTFERAKIERRP